MASQQRAFAHRPGAFAPSAFQQQQQMRQQQNTAQQTVFAQPRQQPPVQPMQPANVQQSQPAPSQCPEFGTDEYYRYNQSRVNDGYVLNRGAKTAQEAAIQQKEYMDRLKAQYDADNDCAKFNMSKEDAAKQKEQLDQMLDVLGSDADMTSAKPMLDTIDKFRWMISQVIASMRDPALWLPEAFVGNEKYVSGYKSAGEKFATALEQYSEKIKLLQDKTETQ